ncbi:MAG: type II secretion system F family protein [Verrucomicrobium sp.]|nr:type II secretion system F family protein [Verrucomicrobium sp.]
MPNFSYTAVNPDGQQVDGLIEAADQNAAAVQIKQMGYFPTRVVPAAEGAASGQAEPKAKRRKQGGKVKSKVLTVFTRQLATLIGASLPLLRALKTLIRQEQNPVLKETLVSLADQVEGGSTFSEALAQHPNVFSKLYVNMVKAGELGGVPEVVLARLAEFQEKSERIKGRIASAMVYPLIVLFMAMVILVFLLIFIVPRFEQIFKDMFGGKPLPWLTQAVIDISRLVQDHILLLLVLVAAAVAGIRIFIRTPKGAVLMDKVKLRAPLIGPLITKTAISRVTRTLGTLISSGVQILPALNITKETAENSIVSAAMEKVHESVKEGETVGAPLEASGIFPPVVVSMVQVGEEVGRLPEMLIKVSDVYEEEIDRSIAALTSLLEPIMIVFLALVVGTIVIALFLPLISIIQNLSNQA